MAWVVAAWAGWAASATTSRANHVAFVATTGELEVAVRAVAAAPIVGFDTEFIGEATYDPKLCLIQVAAGEGTFIIDPLAGLDLQPFWQALTAPGREIVALAARQEILFCLRYAGRPPETVFDPQIAAGLVGFGYPLSHTNLVQRVLNLKISGGEAYTDWSRRPLAPRQVTYAAADVLYLAALRTSLLEKAAMLKRTAWLRSECAETLGRVISGENEERWRRVSGASGLSRRELAVLRELWRWRDSEARSANLPPRRIMADDLMVLITRRGPSKPADLFSLRGMDRVALRRSGEDIAAAVRAGLSLPEAELPVINRNDDPPQVAPLTQLASILTNALATEHQVDVALLVTTADLQEFIRWRLRGGEGGEPALLAGWQGEILGRPLLDLIEGRTVIRVADAASSTPLRFESR